MQNMNMPSLRAPRFLRGVTIQSLIASSKKALLAMTSMLLMLSLTSCGFHLRGEMPLAQPLHNLYVQSTDPYGILMRNLQQSLKMSNVHLTDKPTDATTILSITHDDTDQQLRASAARSKLVNTNSLSLLYLKSLTISDAPLSVRRH